MFSRLKLQSYLSLSFSLRAAPSPLPPSRIQSSHDQPVVSPRLERDRQHIALRVPPTARDSVCLIIPVFSYQSFDITHKVTRVTNGESYLDWWADGFSSAVTQYSRSTWRRSKCQVTQSREPAWPSGKALVRLVSRKTSVRLRFGSPFSSRIAICGHRRVTLSLTINETLKRPSYWCRIKVQELCESRGGRPGLSVLMSLTVSVDVKQHCHWTMLVPNMSTDIRGHEALHHHHAESFCWWQCSVRCSLLLPPPGISVPASTSSETTSGVA